MHRLARRNIVSWWEIQQIGEINQLAQSLRRRIEREATTH
jgi:hypothetical protein